MGSVRCIFCGERFSIETVGQQTKESPGKEDENRGFAWGKGMLSSGLRHPLVSKA
jgi:hypothetical protein